MLLFHADKIDVDKPCPDEWVDQCVVLTSDLVLPVECNVLPDSWTNSHPAAIICKNTDPFAARLLSQAEIHVATTTDSLAGIRDGAEVTLDRGASVVKDDAGRKYALVIA
ncbi:MAG: hypothetical protein ACYTDT_02955 [Planctomycetota bacterium]|jgi:hypothetical protein